MVQNGSNGTNGTGLKLAFEHKLAQVTQRQSSKERDATCLESVSFGVGQSRTADIGHKVSYALYQPTRRAEVSSQVYLVSTVT